MRDLQRLAAHIHGENDTVDSTMQNIPIRNGVVHEHKRPFVHIGGAANAKREGAKRRENLPGKGPTTQAKYIHRSLMSIVGWKSKFCYSDRLRMSKSPLTFVMASARNLHFGVFCGVETEKSDLEYEDVIHVEIYIRPDST